MRKKINFFIPLRIKLILSFFVVSIFPLFITLFITINKIPKDFEKISEMRLNNSLFGISNHYDLILNSLYNALSKFSNDETIKLELIKKFEFQELSQRTLIDKVIEIRETSSLNILEVEDSNGILIADGRDIAKFNINKSSIESIKTALSGKVVTSIEKETSLESQNISLLISFPVYYNGSVIGLLRGGYYLNKDFINNLSQLSNSLVLLFQGNNLLIPQKLTFKQSETQYLNNIKGRKKLTTESIVGFFNKIHNNFIKIIEKILIGDEFKNLTNINYLTHSFKGKRFLKVKFNKDKYIFSSIPIKDFYKKKIIGNFVVGVNLSQPFSIYLSLATALIYLSGLCILFSILMGIILSNKITKPIYSLVQGTKELASGNLTTKVIKTQSNDELGILINSFNAMSNDLKEYQEKLIKAERLATWEDIARKLAHEIKNPLTPIQISIQNLQKCYSSNKETFNEIFDDCSRIILSEIEKLRKLANEFSLFSKLPSSEKKYENIISILQNSITLYQAEFKNVKIIADVELGFPKIKANAESINIIFSNLIKNAIDAMPNGGTLTITAKVNSNFAMIEFKDTGFGIKKEDIDKIFNPYFTTKARGSGLGLPIVQKLIENHNGKIQVESEEGKNTTFTVFLPID